MNLTSPKNPRVQEVAKLRVRRHRDRLQRFVVEGSTEVLRALERGLAVETLFLRDDAEFDSPRLSDSVEVVRVHERAFAKMAYRENPDGVLAVAATFSTHLNRLENASNGLWLVAVGIEKPGNLGAMLRTADGAGVRGLIIADGVTDIFNPNVIRASLGTVFSVPIATSDGSAAIDWFAKRGTQMIATSPAALVDYDQATYGEDVAVVVGPEHAGLAARWLEGTTVRIPMAGIADSLNASVSAGIVLFEALRQERVRRA